MSQRITVKIPDGEGFDSAVLTDIVRKMMSDFSSKDYSITISAVSDEVMADLNQRFRGIRGTTDVLSFLMEEDPLEGEIYLSQNQANEAARENGTSPVQEVYKLTMHGVLHLLGYHHDSPEDERQNRELIHRYLEIAVMKSGSV